MHITFAAMLRRITQLDTPHFAALLCVLVLIRGIALMCVLPPGEGWDEYQHVAYVHELAQGRGRPTLDVTNVDPAVIAAAVSVPMSPSAAAQLQAHGAATYEQYWNANEPELSAAPGDVRLYQAQHAPLWYRLVAPVYAATGGADSWPTSVATLRAANLLLLCLATLLAIATVRILWPQHHPLVTIAIALSPMMLLNAVRAANDALAMVFTAASVLFIALALRRPIALAIPAALFAAAAFWSKTTSIALLPFGAAALLLCTTVAWKQRIAAAALFSAIFLATITPYLLHSHATYGVLIPAQESIRLREAGHGLGAQLNAALQINWLDEVHAWWTRGTLWIGGWSFIRTAGIWRTLYQLLLLGGLVAWILSLAQPRLHTRAETILPWRIGLFCLFLLIAFTAALAAHAVSTQLAWGAVKTNPWYASAAIPMLLLLVIGGYARALPARAATITALAIPLLYLIVEFTGLLVRMPLRYALELPWNGGAWRLASLQPALLGKYTFALALVIELAVLALVARALYRCRLSMCQKDT